MNKEKAIDLFNEARTLRDRLNALQPLQAEKKRQLAELRKMAQRRMNRREDLVLYVNTEDMFKFQVACGGKTRVDKVLGLAAAQRLASQHAVGMHLDKVIPALLSAMLGSTHQPKKFITSE